jgi:hypothetical protein
MRQVMLSSLGTLGVRVFCVTIVPADGADGSVRHSTKGIFGPKVEGLDDREFIASGKIIRRSVLVSLAGMEAQRKVMPSSVRNYHASADYENALEFALKESPNNSELLLRYLCAEAADLVALRWGEICTVADALLQNRTLRFHNSKLELPILFQEHKIQHPFVLKQADSLLA